MKNKITLLIAFIANFYFTTPAHCQTIINDDSCCSEYDIEAPATGIDCGVHHAYRYVSLGMGPLIFMPNVGIGYRERHSQFGWDTAFSFSTLVYPLQLSLHQLSLHQVGHYYFSPLWENPAYLGLGLMESIAFTNNGDGEGFGTLSPDFVFGKQFGRQGSDKHFIEMHVAIPTLLISSCDTSPMYYPLIYVKYGIAF